MRIVATLHGGGEAQRQVALVAVDAAGEIDGGPVVLILLHLQADVAHGHLLAVLMLEEEHAVGHLQLAHVVRPSAVLRSQRQGVVMRHHRRGAVANRLGFRGQLDHRPLEHHLLHLQLVRKQRQQRHVEAHVVGADHRLFGASGGQRHASAENAELRPDVPAQRAIEFKLITAALCHLMHHIGAKIVGIDQQYQRGKPGDNDRQQDHQRCQYSSHGTLSNTPLTLSILVDSARHRALLVAIFGVFTAVIWPRRRAR